MLLVTASEPDVLLIAVGEMAEPCLQAAENLAKAGISTTVAAPVWVKPVPASLVELARTAGLVVVVEDGVRVGGIAALVALALAEADCHTAVRGMGIPARFLQSAKRAAILDQIGLSAAGIADSVQRWWEQFAHPSPTSEGNLAEL